MHLSPSSVRLPPTKRLKFYLETYLRGGGCKKTPHFSSLLKGESSLLLLSSSCERRIPRLAHHHSSSLYKSKNGQALTDDTAPPSPLQRTGKHVSRSEVKEQQLQLRWANCKESFIVRSREEQRKQFKTKIESCIQT